MRNPAVMTSPLRSSNLHSSMASTESGAQSFVVNHRMMKKGLLAKAAVYTNNANTPTKTIPAVPIINGIPLLKRDPIVWGDASNRYISKVNEINNNNEKQKCEGSTQNDISEPSENKFHHTSNNYIQLTPMSLPPATVTTENGDEVAEGTLKGILKMSESQNIETTVDIEFKDTQENLKITKNETDPKRLSFDTTQQLRSGFFRSIKRQYSPLMPSKNDVKQTTPVSSNYSDSDSSSGQSNVENGSHDTEENESEIKETYSTMSQLARQKLEQLRRQGPDNVDVATGLQWIRLELHEMREQDKSLFLQLIKLHSTIKDLRADFSGADNFDSYDDLHSAASLWWPRRQYSFTALPDFSSSDGAQVFRGVGRPKAPLRRGFSLNYPPSGSPIHSATNSMQYDDLHSNLNDSDISIFDSDLNKSAVS